jgi:DNA repair protein RadC
MQQGDTKMIYEAIYTKKVDKKILLLDADDAYRLVKKYTKSRNEQEIVITMDKRRTVLGVHTIHIGTTDSTLVSMKEIFYKAIMDNATCIIVCHNHFGDCIEPSIRDLKAADNIYKAGTIMDIPVKDQLIISEYGYTSIKPSIKAVMKKEIKL